MKNLQEYILEKFINESGLDDFIEVESGINTRKDPKHLELVKMFPESEGWTKVYRSEVCHKGSKHGNYDIVVGHLKNGKYAVRYRITDNIVEYPKEWKQLHEQIFNTMKDARKFIDTKLREQFEESDDYFKDNYLKLWKI